MIDFIWHLCGSTSVAADLDSGTITERIERLLKNQRKDVTEKSDVAISFYTPLWSSMFGPNWKAMVIYDRGRFWLEGSGSDRRLRYDLRSLHGFVYCLCGAAFFFIFTVFGNGLQLALGIAALMFSWLYGMNMLLAWVRIPLVIRQATRKP